VFGYRQPAFIEKISWPHALQASFRIIKHTNGMRKTFVIVAILIAMCFQGCIVVSIYPFYKEADITYNKSLEGDWVDQDRNNWRIHKNPLKPNSYELHATKNGREATLLCHLFKLNGELYMDMTPISDNTEEILVFDLHMIPAHSIAKVTELTDQAVNIKWFNEERLRTMFTENRIKISHELIMDQDSKSKDDGIYLLTASTDELQKFVTKYGNDESMYDNDLKLQLTK